MTLTGGTAGSRGNWTLLECDAVVAAYFDMMAKEVRGEFYVKRRLIADLRAGSMSTRSRQSIEYKLRNVSAILQDRGLTYLSGYVPAFNAQHLLAERVDAFLAAGSHVFDPLPASSVGENFLDIPPSFDPDAAARDDARVRVDIRRRRGQQDFRRDLMQAYGGHCQVTGCAVVAVLEAAHIAPYAGPEFNNPANGLLLRADLHTLFDLDLIGIHPDTLTLYVAPPAGAAPYGDLQGHRLHTSESLRPSTKALCIRWDLFVRAVKDSGRRL